MKLFSILLAALLSLPVFAGAAVIEEGTGIVYGENHVFSFTAPKGWVLDTESTPRTKVHAAFYPKGSTWKESKVVAYATARAKTETRKSVDELVAETLKAIHADDSPKAQVKFVGKLPNGRGQELAIYVFFGDKSGSFQAVAYAEERRTINALIYTSPDEKAFKESFTVFEELAKSYVFISEVYDVEALKAAREKAEQLRRKNPDGK